MSDKKAYSDTDEDCSHMEKKRMLYKRGLVAGGLARGREKKPLIIGP